MTTALKTAAEQMEKVMESLNEAFYAAKNDDERWVIHKQIEAARTQLLNLLGLYREAERQERKLQYA